MKKTIITKKAIAFTLAGIMAFTAYAPSAFASGAEETANGNSLIYLLSSMALAMMIALSTPAVLRRRNDGSEK